MSSDRFEVQAAIESEIGCDDPSELTAKKGLFKQRIEAISLTEQLLKTLERAAASDAANTYFKALLTIVEAFEGIVRGTHSWAVVKLYYSTFYLLRCRMAGMGCVFFKCAGNIYSVSLHQGATPILRSKGKFLGSDIRGDHKTTIATYVTDVGKGDALLTNTIESESVFQWMMKARENIHYRSPKFLEPEFGHFEDGLFSEQGLSYWIDKYLQDSSLVYCFLKEHCSLATSLVLAQATLQELGQRFHARPLSSDQYHYMQDRLSLIFRAPNEFYKIVGAAADAA